MIIAILKSNIHKIFMEYIKNIKTDLHYTPLITDIKTAFFNNATHHDKNSRQPNISIFIKCRVAIEFDV